MECRQLLYESAFWRLEEKDAVIEHQRLLYEHAIRAWIDWMHELRERKKVVASLRNYYIRMLRRNGQPLPIMPLKRYPCIEITLRHALSGVTHEARFPVGTLYKEFFPEVRRLFGHPTHATSTSVVVTKLSGTHVEGKSEKKLETNLHGCTLLCGFYAPKRIHSDSDTDFEGVD